MSTRRKSSATGSPVTTPGGVQVAVSTTAKSKKRQAHGKVHANSRAQPSNTKRNGTRTLKLQASAPRIVGDLSLEEILRIEPLCLREENALKKEEATAERIEEAKESLGRLESEIVSALFPRTGLPDSVEQIAARFGMTVKEVRDVADNALRGLRGTKSSRPRLSTVWN